MWDFWNLDKWNFTNFTLIWFVIYGQEYQIKYGVILMKSELLGKIEWMKWLGAERLLANKDKNIVTVHYPCN